MKELQIRCTAALGVFAVLACVVSAQGGRGGQAPPRTVSSPRDAYPARPADDPAAIERGKALYGVNCQFCHGADTRGGDSGPSLLRSGVVLDDQHGELMAPIIQNGRTDRGMPKFAFTNEQVADVAAFVHTFRAAGYDESRQKPPSIVIGDARAGESFFTSRCASCHAVGGDLKGIASRIADERLLQQTWLMPGTGGGRGGPPPVTVKPARATVTLPSGEKVSGVIDRIDDFAVSLKMDDGSFRSFRTPPGSKTVVDIQDPLKPHKDLLTRYTDADIHNVTAYLVTLK
jgi:cytochrome c oxidase cbb3-type subunit 3